MRSQLDSSKQLVCCRIWGQTYQEDGPSPSSAFPTTPPATTFQAARPPRWRSIRSMRTTLLSSVVSFCGCGAGRTLFFPKGTVEAAAEAIRLEGPARRPLARALKWLRCCNPAKDPTNRADNAVNSERHGKSDCEAYPQILRKIRPPLWAKGSCYLIYQFVPFIAR